MKQALSLCRTRLMKQVLRTYEAVALATVKHSA